MQYFWEQPVHRTSPGNYFCFLAPFYWQSLPTKEISTTFSWKQNSNVGYEMVVIKSSHQRCSVKKLFLETSQNSQEKTCARAFFNKVAGLRLCHRCFPVNFIKFLRTTFFIKHLCFCEVLICGVVQWKNKLSKFLRSLKNA